MTKLQKMVRDIYIHKFRNPKNDLSKGGYIVNLQMFIDGINDPVNLINKCMDEKTE